MNHDWLDAHLLGLPGAEKDYKPEWQWDRYMVRGKLFAALCSPEQKYQIYGGHDLITLKCDPRMAELFRAEYPAVLPGFYMEKRGWNSILLDGDLPEDVLREMCDMSHRLVLEKLPKRVQKEIAENHPVN